MWMFGLRTTVKKVRNSLTWFSHGSAAILAPEPLARVPFSTTRVFETLFSVRYPHCMRIVEVPTCDTGFLHEK